MKWHHVILWLLGFVGAITLGSFSQSYGTRLLFAHVIVGRIAEPIAETAEQHIVPPEEGRALMEWQERRIAPASVRVWAQMIASFALNIVLVAFVWAYPFGFLWRKFAKGKPLKHSHLIMAGLCFSFLMSFYSVVSTYAGYAERGIPSLSEVYGLSPADADVMLNPHFFEVCRQVTSAFTSCVGIALMGLLVCSALYDFVRRRKAKPNG